MTTEKLMTAMKIKEELDIINGIMEMLGGRLGSDDIDAIKINRIRFNECKCRPTESLSDIPPELGKEIIAVLHDFFLKKQMKITKEWEELWKRCRDEGCTPQP